jgi:hypothetical protein
VSSKLCVTPEVRAAMVQAVGIDPAIRLFKRVEEQLLLNLDALRARRDPQDPACFLVGIRPLVVIARGGWFDCTFSVDDQREVDALWLVTFRAEFRPIGPI